MVSIKLIAILIIGFMVVAIGSAAIGYSVGTNQNDGSKTDGSSEKTPDTIMEKDWEYIVWRLDTKGHGLIKDQYGVIYDVPLNASVTAYSAEGGYLILDYNDGGSPYKFYYKDIKVRTDLDTNFIN